MLEVKSAGVHLFKTTFVAAESSLLRATLMRPVPVLRRLRATNLVLLLVVHITARVISMSLTASSPGMAFIQDSLIFSQTALLVIWLSAPDLRWWSRASAAVLSWLLLFSIIPIGRTTAWELAQDYQLISWARTAILGQDSASYQLPMMLIESAGMGIVLMVCRGCGIALRPEHRVAAREFHFSLRALIGLTTLAALGTWSIEFARAHLPHDVVAPIPFVLWGLGSGFAIVALAALWAVLVRRRWPLTIPLVAGLALSLGPLGAYVWHRPEDGTMIGLWMLTHGVLVLGSLLAVRASGWRFGTNNVPARSIAAPECIEWSAMATNQIETSTKTRGPKLRSQAS